MSKKNKAREALVQNPNPDLNTNAPIVIVSTQEVDPSIKPLSDFLKKRHRGLGRFFHRKHKNKKPDIITDATAIATPAR